MCSFATRWRLFLDGLRVEYGVARHRLADRKLLMAFFRLFLVMTVLFIIGFVIVNQFSDAESLLTYVRSAGVFGPFMIIGFIILEVVVAPIPGTFIVVGAGALFGTWFGALYAYIGNVLGSVIAFWLAKRFGRRLVERLVSTPLLKSYDSFFNGHKELFLVFYALPVIPVDVLSFVCGLSLMRWRRFLFVMMFGFIPNTIILAFLGEQLASLSVVGMVFYTIIFLVVFSVFAWLFKLLVARVQVKKDI